MQFLNAVKKYVVIVLKYAVFVFKYAYNMQLLSWNMQRYEKFFPAVWKTAIIFFIEIGKNMQFFYCKMHEYAIYVTHLFL